MFYTCTNLLLSRPGIWISLIQRYGIWCKISGHILEKTGHTCGVNKKGHILVNLGQFEDETPLISKQNKCLE